MKLKIVFYILVYFFSFESLATNIRVVDLQNLIDNNEYLKIMITDIKEDQIIHTNEFKKIEKNLKNELNRINESKLILDNNQIDQEINKFIHIVPDEVINKLSFPVIEQHKIA